MYIDYMDGMESVMSSFVMLPKVMLQDRRFRSLSVESKVVYSLALDRVKLSVKNTLTSYPAISSVHTRSNA